MNLHLRKVSSAEGPFVAVLMRSDADTDHPLLKPWRDRLLKENGGKDNGMLLIYSGSSTLAVVMLEAHNALTRGEYLEEARIKGGQLAKKIQAEKCTSVTLLRASGSVETSELLSFTEGIVLNSYQFLKYKSDTKPNPLQEIALYDDAVSQERLSELENVLEANAMAKDLGNEPVNALNSVQLGEHVAMLAKRLHFHAEVLNKKQIEALRMGGLLGVNMGSSVPPTFSILEYKPDNAKNKKPLVLVGKGVTYDTGGYSLKPSSSMSGMKMDMCGAAAVIGTFQAVVKNALPVYCVGLIPSTDNRISSDALTPDDVITIHNGTTVEVLNTDAEGRLILADALSYAKQYDPELVIDLATLTGAAVAMTGTLGSALMGTDNTYREALIRSGELTYERIWEIPYWKEFADMLKSDVADMKNIGGPYGGSATAGKFLQHFTSYPWLHLDIAGPAILKDEEPYKQKGASGVGIRLLYHFIRTAFAGRDPDTF